MEDENPHWIASFLQDAPAFIAELGVLGLLTVFLFTGIWWWIGGLKDSPKTRGTLEKWLTHDTVGNAYRDLLTRALDRLDRWLCSPAELALPDTEPRQGWSTKLLSYTLVFA